MILEISPEDLSKIHVHGEAAYPEEGAGLLLGVDHPDGRQVKEILALENAGEANSRHNRYLITPQDLLSGEKRAAQRGLEVIGVFHSHPDHPNRPSEFDRQWALPWFSYVITGVNRGKAVGSRSWRLSDNRQRFDEEQVVVSE